MSAKQHVSRVSDLAEIQERLNDSEIFRKAFVEDPVGTLENEGFALSSEMEASLRAFSRKARLRHIHRLRR